MDRRIIRTRIAIRDALIALIDEKGFDSLSVKDITTRANINRGTFYLHYKDKYDLLDQTLTEVSQDLEKIFHKVKILSASDFKNIKVPFAIVVKLFEYFNKNASLMQAVLGSKGNFNFQTKMKKVMWNNLFEKNYSTLLKKEDLLVPGEYFLSYIASAHFGVVQEWLERGRKESPEEMARILTKLTFHGPLFAAGITIEER